MSNDITTITLKVNTRDKLAAIGTKDDSFDEIVNRLCDFWNRYKDVVRV